MNALRVQSAGTVATLADTVSTEANRILSDAQTALRDQLFGLSQNGDFSPAEREGFARLRMFYHQRLERFFLAPYCGETSARYDQPLIDAHAAISPELACRPGNQPSQQTYYDAVYASSDSLKNVTSVISKPFRLAPT